MTGLLINGVSYTVDNIGEATMGDLYTLLVKTKARGYPVSLKSINEMFDRLGSKATVEAERAEERDRRLAANPAADVSDLPEWDPMELLADEDYLANMVGLVYLARRTAGDPVSVDDAWNVPFNSVTLAGDDDEDPEAGGVPAPKDEAPLTEDVPVS